MSATVTPVGVCSPRRLNHAPALSSRQFWTGMLWAWITSSVAQVIGWGIYMVTAIDELPPQYQELQRVWVLLFLLVAPFATLIYGAWICVALGAPLGLLLGRMLRRVRSITLHVLLFMALGAVIGAVAGFAYFACALGGFQIPDEDHLAQVLPEILITTMAGGIGAGAGRLAAARLGSR